MRAVLLLWLLCQPTLASSQQKAVPKPNSDQPQAQADRRGTQDSPLVIKVLDPERTKEQAAQDAEDRKANAATDRTIVRLTTYLVLVGIVQAFVFFMQWRMMRRAGDIAKGQSRAYLTVRQGKIFAESRPKETWWLEWQPQVINAGQTPAYGVDVWARVALMPDPLPPDTAFTFPDTHSDSASRSTIGPGQDIWPARWLGSAVPDSQMRDLKARDMGSAFYVYGTVAYRDIFRKEHRTNFCLMAIWPREGPAIARYTNQHNDSD